jgi:Prealbumin-like fold domain
MGTAGAAGHPANLGSAYISNVTSNGNCVASTTNGGGIQFWDIQAGGTYTVTLSGVTDCASQGNENTIGVIVHNSTGGNIGESPNPISATLVDSNVPGVYSFTVTLTTQCLTMPIEYCTVNGQPGTGMFAQDNVGGVAGGHQGHLRTTIFDGSCVKQGDDTTCQTTCAGASIRACKYYDFNVNGTKQTGEQLLGWPFCLTSVTDSAFSPVQQTSSDGSCTTFNNLPPGTYVVTEGSATGYFGSTNSSTITIDHCGQTVEVAFGNYCTVNSGGLTLGFWSNKNGNKLLTGNTAGTGTALLPGVRDLLNSCSLRNANGTIHTFSINSTSYADLRNWLLGATATNMAYMLSAQLATLKLDVYFNKVDGNAFDLCSDGTVNALLAAACADLATNGYTLSGNVNRPPQELWKNCMDAINNNGPVVPVTPCDHSGASVSCGQ